MVELAVDICPLTDDELALVEKSLNYDWGNPQKHRERLEAQQRGELVYLIAWVSGRPVGHAALKWAGKRHEAVAGKLGRCPNVSDLFVAPDWRAKGIGTDILAAVQSLALESGYPRVGMGVAIDNPHAKALYERLGYRDSGMGEYVSRWSYFDRDGREYWHEETCTYLVRDLP